jgi:hypothetical protein
VTSTPSGPAARPPGRSGPRRSTLWTLAAAGLAVIAAWRSNNQRGVPVAPAALHLYSIPARPPHIAESVSVLLPIRHDEQSAVTAATAALAQTGVAQLDVVLLDDGCPQATRAALSREFGDDPRVRILAAAPLPAGWCAAAHRAHQLAVAARGSILLFADPAAPLGPEAAAAVAALLRAEKLDLAVLDSGRRGDRGQPTPRGRSGRFTVAVDTAAYWRLGGYRAAAADPNPLALLRTIRKATGRTGVADGRRVIPPTYWSTAPGAPDNRLSDTSSTPPPPAKSVGGSGIDTGTGYPSRPSLTDTARRLLSALVGTR